MVLPSTLSFISLVSSTLKGCRSRANICTNHFLQKPSRSLSFRSNTSTLNPINKSTVIMSTTDVVGKAPSINPPSELLDALVTTAETALDKANPIIMQHFRADTLSSSYKEDESPVTVADRQAESIIIQTIRSAFPDHAILAEETGNHGPSDADVLWVIDPLDGTKAFVGGRPTFTTLISVLWKGTPIVGIISQPVTCERWVGVITRGTTLNGKPISTSKQISCLSDVSVHATTPDMFTGTDFIPWSRLLDVVRHPVYGGDAYAYASMASGASHIVVEADLKPWDFLALVPVVQGAGGFICDWQGSRLNLESDGRIIAAPNAELLGATLNVLECDITSQFKRDINPVSELLLVPDSKTLPRDPGPNQKESMTGFGSGSAQCGNLSVHVELRSVNGRNANVKFRGSQLSPSIESEFNALVRNTLLRGRIDVLIKVSVKNGDNGNSSNMLRVDRNAVRAAKNLLSEIAEEAQIVQPPSFADILSFSNIISKQNIVDMTSNVIIAYRDALTNGIINLQQSRRREGAFLQADIQERITKIGECVDEIEDRAPGRVDALIHRLNEMLGESDSDPQFTQEIVQLANRIDISEEVQRLRSHMNELNLTFYGAKEPIGQRLVYYVQEMLREATTIASKASNAPIARMTILIREELDKIREQCQNLC